MTMDMSKFGPALKQLYTNQKVENLTYPENPFYAMLAKDKGFFGDSFPQPLQYGNPQNSSHTFSDAQGNNTSSTLGKFLLTRVSDYSIARVQNEVAEASQNDKGAFLKALTNEIDSAMMTAAASLSIDLFGNASGSRGRIGATTNLATTSLVLADIDSVVRYEIGMKLTFAAAESAGAERDGGASLTVVGVNRDTGVLTMSAALNTIAAIAVADYIFLKGNRNKSIAGLDAWIPAADPTAGDNFFGLDRSVDPTRLGGLRFDASSMSIEEGMIKALARLCREGGRPDLVFVNYLDFADLEAALGSKVQYMVTQAFANGKIGFNGIQIKHNKGVANVVADQYCPRGVAYALTSKTWVLRSLKEPVRILDLDGNKVLRVTNDDAVEARIGGYRQLACNAPGWNMRIKLA